MTLEIEQFPCKSDNFGVLLHDTKSGATASIDAPEEKAIRDKLAEKKWRLDSIFTTHHHADHTEGNLPLKADFRRPSPAPPARPTKIPGIDKTVQGRRQLPLRRQRGARDRHARPHARPHRLLDAGRRRRLCRRHAVRDRLRPRHRGHARDDVGIALEAGSLARRDGDLLRPRIHRGQCPLRADHRAGQCRSGRSAPPKSAASAPPASRPCRRRSASRRRPIRSCAPTSPTVRAAVGLPNAPAAEVFAEVRKRKDNFK